MDKKLTDSEIKKALECAIRNDCDCNCVFLLPNKVQDVLDLINRLQAENERLSQFGGILLRNGSELFKEIQTAKAEARKEFTERLKKEAFKINYCGSSYNVVDTDDIDNLLKELVGEDNA